MRGLIWAESKFTENRVNNYKNVYIVGRGGGVSYLGILLHGPVQAGKSRERFTLTRRSKDLHSSTVKITTGYKTSVCLFIIMKCLAEIKETL